jgi:uncharacterized protein (DUF1697 family)
MRSYAILLRGINVGGKNKISMAELRRCLEEDGFEDVITYIQSGNVVLRSTLGADALRSEIESLLPEKFRLDSSVIRILPIDHKAFAQVVAQAPSGFGNDTAHFRYNVIFLMGVGSREAMAQIDVREGIDRAWQGEGVIYYRLPSLTSPDAAKSYLGKLTQKPLYQSVTIRNWNTTVKLLGLLEEHRAGRRS